MSVGRNEPCSCGSGKKFKRCCGAPPPLRNPTPADTCWSRYRRLKDEYRSEMSRFVSNTFETETIDAAWTAFLGDAADLEGFDLPIEFDPDSPISNLFTPWFYHHWVANQDNDPGLDDDLAGQTPTQLFLAARGARLEPAFRQYLDDCMAMHPRFLTVGAVERDRGFSVDDLWTGAKEFVHDRGATENLAEGQILLAQTVPFESIVVMEAAPPWALPASVATDLKRLYPGLLEQRVCAADDIPRVFEAGLRKVYFGMVWKLAVPPPID